MKSRISTLTLAIAMAAIAATTAAAQQAVPRGTQDGGDKAAPAPPPQGARSPSTPRESGPAPQGGGSAGPASTRGGDPRSGSGTTKETPSGDSGDTAGRYGRPRDGAATGTAVARTSPPPRNGDGPDIVYPYPIGYYPWGYGGYGFGGYGGYYGGYDDPWGYGYAQNYGRFEGSLRLKIKPNDASVFVDGYYTGQVDDFDGIFQRLRVEPGPHRIEIREDGYEPLFFDVRVLSDRTITYKGELKRDRRVNP